MPYGLAVKCLEHGCVQARQERARHTIAVFVGLLAGCRMSGTANHNKSEDDPTGPLQYTLHNGLSYPAEAGYYTTRSDLITRAARVWFAALQRAPDEVSSLTQADEQNLNVDPAMVGKQEPECQRVKAAPYNRTRLRGD